MKRKFVIFTILLIFTLNLFGTPDSSIHVIDQLFGFHENSVIIRQLVIDNLGSYYNNHIQIYLIEKSLNTGKIINQYKIADYEQKINIGNFERSGKTEEKIIEIINKRPELFYDIEYAIPIGKPKAFSLNKNILSIQIKGNEKKEYNLYDSFPELKKLPEPNELLQVYIYKEYYVLLVDFGNSNYDTDYYQKIIIIHE